MSKNVFEVDINYLRNGLATKYTSKILKFYLSPVLFIKDFNSLLSVMLDKADRHQQMFLIQYRSCHL